MISTITETLEHVLFLTRHLNNCDSQGIAVVILMELGVPTKCVGFEFLKRAILLFYEDPTRALSKDIYQEIKLKCKLSSEEQVDQAMRDATSKAWSSGSTKAWRWYFAYNGESLQHKPSNAEFITRIARILELWQRICKGGVNQ